MSFCMFFLCRLSKYDLGLNWSTLNDYFPGRKQQVDCTKSGREQTNIATSPTSLCLLSSVASAESPIDVESHPSNPLPMKKIL